MSAAPEDVWCAVADQDEYDAVFGLAHAIEFDPWPGERAALAALVASVPITARQVVQTVRAGCAADARTIERMRGGKAKAALLVPSKGRGVGVRGVRWAILRPGAGMTIRGQALTNLAAAGWLKDAELTVNDVREIAGPIGRARVPEPRPINTYYGQSSPQHPRLSVTLVIPAKDEAAWIGDTVRSIHAQSRRPDEILVIDDGSTDETGEIAQHLGAKVIRTPGTGSKGGAINFALPSITSDVIILVDADTRLHQDAIRYLMRDMETGMAATHGSVLPAIERGIWAHGRMIEYALALRLMKKVQRVLGQLVVLSGCVLAIRTDVLRKAEGFQARTMVEDLDLTWTLQTTGITVDYTPKAVAYPIEPETWAQYKGQMRRWTRGFFQSVAVHVRDLRKAPALAFIVIAALWDILTLPLVAVVFVGLATAGSLPHVAVNFILFWQLLWTVIAAVVASTALGPRRALRATPAFAAMSMLCTYFYFEAFISEWVLRRRSHVWVKGH